MALNTFVLISTVNNLSDARYCAGMHVDLIGFNLEEQNANYIAPNTYKELTEWLSGIEFVGEFVDSNAPEIKATLENYNPQYLEVCDSELVESLNKTSHQVILRQSINSIEDLSATFNSDYLVLEKDSDEMDQTDIEKVKALSKNNKVLIGFGITDKNVETLLDQTNAYGISLKGGDELKPGYKDYDALADILEVLEIDDLA